MFTLVVLYCDRAPERYHTLKAAIEAGKASGAYFLVYSGREIIYPA